MTKKEILNAPSVAYYSGLNGLEIKGIEYGGRAAQRAHRVKVNYTRTGAAFIRVNGQRVPLNECIRMGV